MKSSLSLQKFLPFLCLALPFLVIAALGFIFVNQQRAYEILDARLESNLTKAFKMRKKEEANELVRVLYTNIDSSYLSRELEGLILLSGEQSVLSKKLSSHLPGGEKLATRLAFLKRDNRLQLVEKNGERKDGIQESVHVLSHPIEIDAHDLKTMLGRLEKKENGSPLLLITDLFIKRKRSLGKNEVFELNLELLKREFLHS